MVALNEVALSERPKGWEKADKILAAIS